MQSWWLKMTKCSYCQDNRDLISVSAEVFESIPAINHFQVSIFKNKLIANVSMYESPSLFDGIKINYCPMCGRELTNENKNG